jgi:hypothetical protein
VNWGLKGVDIGCQDRYGPRRPPMKSPEYTKPGLGDEFPAARDQFEAAIAWLHSEDASMLTHSVLEDRLEEAGREMMRKLFQAHLDLRAVREERLPGVMGRDARSGRM